MDVNRTEGVVPTSLKGGKGGRGHPDKEKSDAHDHDDADDSAVNAYEIDGLVAEITPSAQLILDKLAAEIEPLRHQLALAKEREANLRDDLARHSFLPIPGRREFMRELNHVLNHLNDMNEKQCIGLIHIVNADHIRQTFGRDTLDRMLVHVSHVIGGAIHPTDVLGNLGGNDFALIILGADISVARERVAEITSDLSAITFRDVEGEISIDVASGVAALEAGVSAEAAISAADRDMVR